MKLTTQELTAKFTALPESIQQELLDFVDLKQAKIINRSLFSTSRDQAPIASDKNAGDALKQQLTIPRKAGALAGRIKISEDFNAPLADFSDYEQ